MSLGCTPSELLERATAKELDDFWYLYQIDPWGTTRDNLHFAQVLCSLEGFFSKKGSPKPKIEKYMLTTKAGYKDDEVQDSDEHSKNMLATFGLKK